MRREQREEKADRATRTCAALHTSPCRHIAQILDTRPVLYANFLISLALPRGIEQATDSKSRIPRSRGPRHCAAPRLTNPAAGRCFALSTQMLAAAYLRVENQF